MADEKIIRGGGAVVLAGAILFVGNGNAAILVDVAEGEMEGGVMVGSEGDMENCGDDDVGGGTSVATGAFDLGSVVGG